MSSPHVAVQIAQFSPQLADVRANLDRMLSVVQEARGSGVELVVFPELSLTGYALRDLYADSAVRLDSPEFCELVEASRGVSIAFGFVEETPDHLFYNSAAYVEDGKLIHVHRKIYLPTYGLFEEGRHFATGDCVRSFDTKFGRLALLVCEDVWHLPLPYLAALDGAGAILVLAASPTRGVGSEGRAKNTEGWESLLVTYASALTVFLVFANRVGFEDGVGFWGGSQIVTPACEVVAKATYHEEALLNARMDFDVLRKERLDTPLLRDERIPLVVRELERIQKSRRFEVPEGSRTS